MPTLLHAAVALIAGIFGAFGVYQFAPLSLFDQESVLGASITTIQGSDTLSSSRSVINANFAALNTAKFELSDWYATTSAAQLATLGTITSGTWNAGIVGVPYGGTGWANVQSNALLIGNGTSRLATTTQGSNGEVLQWQNGPIWASAATDLTASYTWTGPHRWTAAASSTLFGILDTLYVGRTASSTIQGSTSGTSELQGFLNVLGTGSATSTFSANVAITGNATTSRLTISGNCVGCTKATRITGNLTTETITNGNTISASASCTGNQVVVGGGVANTNTGGQITDSYPDSATSWTAVWRCTSGTCTNATVRAYAICSQP